MPVLDPREVPVALWWQLGALGLPTVYEDQFGGLWTIAQSYWDPDAGAPWERRRPWGGDRHRLRELGPVAGDYREYLVTGRAPATLDESRAAPPRRYGWAVERPLDASQVAGLVAQLRALAEESAQLRATAASIADGFRVLRPIRADAAAASRKIVHAQAAKLRRLTDRVG